MEKPLFILFSLLILVSSCTRVNNIKSDSVDTIEIVNDNHSYANIDEIKTTHLNLELDVNFENKTIYGVARHEMSDHNCDTAIFDIKGLEIKKVTLGATKEKETNYVIGKNDELLGQPLKIAIEPKTKYINIYYQTTSETEALDWLSPELTAGKKHPFMYTQGQAILTRSWIPLQDSPMNRITYSADVTVPPSLLAVMSASNETTKNNEGKYHFEMKQKIPAYLIALAVGDMVYNSLSEKCGVYSEPELSNACKNEFSDIPRMLSVAEKLYGAYRWEQFDIVILPYSFPFGGMENPRLTFANPTLIAGDKSLVSVIAHELAHSWSGNLVTNATWDDFWLNEGFTVYFENRIMEDVFGKDVANILAITEFQELEVALNDIENGSHPEDSQLKLSLTGRNPDEGMTDIAYVKGAFFLRTIEKQVGRKKFDEFLKNYFDKHAFETITTEAFLSYIENELFKPNNITFNTKQWIYEPGIPDNCIKITSERLNEMSLLADRINNGESIFEGKNKNLQRGDKITQEWQTFIRELSPNITAEQMMEIDEQLKFSKEGNPAIQSDWFQLAVKVGNKSVRPYMSDYLIKIGRRWYIESIYIALKESKDPNDLIWAREVFKKAEANYHYVSKSTIKKLLD